MPMPHCLERMLICLLQKSQPAENQFWIHWYGRMASIKGEKFLELLQKAGYPTESCSATEFDSLFDVGGEFMEWFCEYIDSSNIQRPELFEQTDPEDYLHGEELDIALKEASVNEEDLKVTEVDNEELREEIAVVESQIATYNGIINELRSECEDFSNLMSQLEEEEEKSGSSELKEASSRCCDLGEKLDQLYEAVGNNLHSSVSGMMSKALEGGLLAQMPLNNFKEHMDQYNYLLTQYTSRQFLELSNTDGGKSVLKGPSNAALAKLGQDVQQLQHSINLMLCGVALERAEEKALDAAMEYAKELQAEPDCSPDELDSLQQTIQDEQLQFSNLVAKLKDACCKMTELEVLQKVLVPECQHKLVRKQFWVERLNILHSMVEGQQQLSGVISVAINIERSVVSDIATITAQLQRQLDEDYANFCLRKNGMEAAVHQYDTSNYSQLLSQLMGYSGDFNIAVLKHRQNVADSNRHIFRTLADKKEVIRMNEKTIQKIRNLVFSGPTKKLLNFGKVNMLYQDGDMMIEKYEQMLEELRKRKENFEAEMTVHPYRRKCRLVWIYYLTNPNKLKALCADLQDIVNYMMSMDSPVSSHTRISFRTSTPK